MNRRQIFDSFFSFFESAALVVARPARFFEDFYFIHARGRFAALYAFLYLTLGNVFVFLAMAVMMPAFSEDRWGLSLFRTFMWSPVIFYVTVFIGAFVMLAAAYCGKVNMRFKPVWNFLCVFAVYQFVFHILISFSGVFLGAFKWGGGALFVACLILFVFALRTFYWGVKAILASHGRNVTSHIERFIGWFAAFAIVIIAVFVAAGYWIVGRYMARLVF